MINLKIITNKNIYELKCKKGISLKEVIQKENINFRFPCGGNGRCCNCKVTFLKGVEKSTRLDEMKLKKEEIQQNVRIACCVYLNKDTEIELNEITEFNFLD